MDKNCQDVHYVNLYGHNNIPLLIYRKQIALLLAETGQDLHGNAINHRGGHGVDVIVDFLGVGRLF